MALFAGLLHSKSMNSMSTVRRHSHFSSAKYLSGEHSRAVPHVSALLFFSSLAVLTKATLNGWLPRPTHPLSLTLPCSPDT
jgi:hypothetical protein